jgi:hypothetical protein
MGSTDVALSVVPTSYGPQDHAKMLATSDELVAKIRGWGQEAQEIASR